MNLAFLVASLVSIAKRPMITSLVSNPKKRAVVLKSLDQYSVFKQVFSGANFLYNMELILIFHKKKNFHLPRNRIYNAYGLDIWLVLVLAEFVRFSCCLWEQKCSSRVLGEIRSVSGVRLRNSNFFLSLTSSVMLERSSKTAVECIGFHTAARACVGNEEFARVRDHQQNLFRKLVRVSLVESIRAHRRNGRKILIYHCHHDQTYLLHRIKLQQKPELKILCTITSL